MSDLVLGGFGEQPRIERSRSVRVTSLEQVAAVAAHAELLVPLALWSSPGATAFLANREVVIVLQVSDEPDVLFDRLAEIRALAIEFTNFADGRGYSLAVLLRQRGRYRGQLRALGDVLRDQLFYLLRCGFDAFEPRADRSTEDFIQAYHDFRVVYQRSATSTPLFARREQALAELQGPAP